MFCSEAARIFSNAPAGTAVAAAVTHDADGIALLFALRRAAFARVLLSPAAGPEAVPASRLPRPLLAAPLLPSARACVTAQKHGALVGSSLI